MQRVFRSSLAGVLALAALTACGSKDNGPTGGQIQSVTVTPPNANINVGDHFTFVATVVATGNAARTVTWSSSDPTIATIDASTGIVTGVKGGNTSIVATSTVDASVKGAASVTVGAVVQPTVTIAGLRQTIPGTGSVPANAGNIAGQLDVDVNLDAGTQKVSTVSLIVTCNGKDTTVQTETVTAGDVAPLAASEDASLITFSFNTAAFNPTTGAVAFKNGTCTLKASAVTSGGTVVASNGTPVTFNNVDFVTVTGITTTPSTGQVASANDATGLQWKAGAVNVTAVPVIYTANRSVVSGTINLINTNAASQLGQNAATVLTGGVVATIGGVTPAAGTAVLSATFPNSTTAAGGVGGATVNGLSASVNTVDNSGNPGPAAAAAAAAAVAIRLDNLAPDVVTTPPSFTANTQNSTGGWVGKAFVFSTGAAPANPIQLGSASSDSFLGVTGVDNVVDTTQASQSGGSFANFNGPSSLPETSTGSADALRVKICDALGNCKNSATLATFGVDLTPPSLVVVSAPADKQIFNIGSALITTASFGVTDTSGTAGVTASGSNGVLASLQGLQPNGASSSQTVCPIGQTTGTAPAVTCKAPVAQPLNVALTTTAGEYTFTVQGMDQAGNTSAPVTIHYYVDQAAPAVAGGVAVPASITTGSQFTSTATDNMDVAAGNGNLQYTALATFAEAGTGSPTGVAFDNALTRSSSIVVTLNPFYRSLGTAFNVVGQKPATAGIRAVDAAGNLAVSQPVALPPTNIAAGTAFSNSDPAVGITAWTMAANPNPVDSLKTTTLTASATAISLTSGSPFTQVCFYQVSAAGAEGGVAGPGGSATGELFSLGCTGAETTTGTAPRLLNYSITITAPVITGGGTFNVLAIGQNAGGDGLMTAQTTITVNP